MAKKVNEIAQRKEFAKRVENLNFMEAVILCAQEGGAILGPETEQSHEEEKEVNSESPFAGFNWESSFADFVSRDDPLVLSADEMRSVPEGAFVAFIIVDDPKGSQQFAKRHLLHAMISTGGGNAAGKENRGRIFLGDKNVGWQVIDLANSNRWVDSKGGSNVDVFSVTAPWDKVARFARIRYRYTDIREIGKPGLESKDEIAAAKTALTTWKNAAVGNYVSQIAGRLTGLDTITSRIGKEEAMVKPFEKLKSFGLGYAEKDIYVAFEFSRANPERADPAVKLDGIVKTNDQKVLARVGKVRNKQIIGNVYEFLASQSSDRIAKLDADTKELVETYYKSGWVLSDKYFKDKGLPEGVDAQRWQTRKPNPDERGKMITKLGIRTGMWEMSFPG